MPNHSPSMSRSYFAYEKPSAALVIFTFVTIVQGMLIAIMGLAIGSSIHFPLPIVGFLITGFGMVLIVCQYASTFRRNVYCMWLATAQLLFCCLPCGLMLLIGGCVAAIPLAVSLTTAALNAMWGMSLVEQHSLVPDDHTSEQISLIEIFCAVLIAALILGPASMFYR